MKSVGDYILQTQIGGGMFGEVWKATHKKTAQIYAVKKILVDSLPCNDPKYLLREIETLQGIDSPYVIKLIEPLRTRSSFYLVLEYCEGGNLESLIKSKAPIPEQLIKKWFLQLLNAVSQFNRLEIVHRDFKLANILLTHSNYLQADVKVSDFGFARFIGAEPIDGTRIGTPLTMAPEILSGEDYGSAIDIWSLGCVIYEVIAGFSPFPVKTMDQLREFIRKPIQYPAQFNPLLVDLLSKMLVYSPKLRSTADELINHPYFNIDNRINDLRSNYSNVMHWMNLGYAIMQANFRHLENYNTELHQLKAYSQNNPNLAQLEFSMIPACTDLFNLLRIPIASLNNSSEALLNHSRISAQLGSPGLAAEYLRMGLTLNPNNQEMLEELNRVLNIINRGS